METSFLKLYFWWTKVRHVKYFCTIYFNTNCYSFLLLLPLCFVSIQDFQKLFSFHHSSLKCYTYICCSLKKNLLYICNSFFQFFLFANITFDLTNRNTLKCLDFFFFFRSVIILMMFTLTGRFYHKVLCYCPYTSTSVPQDPLLPLDQGCKNRICCHSILQC